MQCGLWTLLSGNPFGFCLYHIASVFLRLKSVIFFFAQNFFTPLSETISVKSKQNLLDDNDQILVKILIWNKTVLKIGLNPAVQTQQNRNKHISLEKS